MKDEKILSYLLKGANVLVTGNETRSGNLRVNYHLIYKNEIIEPAITGNLLAKLHMKRDKGLC